MAISVFTSSSAFLRAMGVPADGVSAFTDPMNTVVDGDAMLSEGESGYVDLSSQPDNVAQDASTPLSACFSPANFVAQDFSPASSIGRAEALRYDWYGGERLAESPATAFLKRLLDPLNRIVRVASLFGDVTALPGYVGEGLRPLPQFREPAEGLPYELGSPHLPASGLVAAAGAPDDEHGGSTAVRSEEGARELMRRLKAEWDDVTWTLVRKIEAGEDVNEIMIWMNVVDSWQQNIKQVRKLRIDLEKSGRLTPALAFEMRSFVHDVLARDVNVFLNGQNALSWKDSAQEALVSLWKTFSPTTPVLADFVGKALDKFHFEAAKRKVSFKDVKISDPAFAPHVPLEKVRAVLENIIENAVKYNKDGGTVKVGFDRALRELVVEDTGIGMAPEFAAQWGTVQGVREGRAMNSDGTPVEGTGAGSVIVKRAIEELGWELRIESAPDAGSKFIITIPEKDLVSAGKVMLPGKGPAVELPDVVPAERPNEIRLHVGVSDDLKSVTYSLVDDMGEIKALSTVPSSYLVTPERSLTHRLSDELKKIILPLIKAARRLTTYRGITVSWDLAADKDVWTTNIDTIFLHKRAEDAGILNDPSVRSALEVGVGGAHSSVAMAQYLPNLARLSVTDISHNALRVARLMLDPAIKNGLPVRYYWGKGLRTIDDKFDLIWVNPPYIPVPPSMARGDGDPYRGTGLIREIFEMGVERLNSDNPNARIVTNISSLAAKDLARYMEAFGDRLIVEKLGEPLKVPLKIGAIDKAWLDWLVSEGGLEFRPDAASDEEPYWHTLQAYSIRPKPAGASATSTVTHPLTGEALDLKALDKKAIFALIMEGRAYFKQRIARVAERLKAGEDPKKLGADVVGDEDAKRVMNDMIDVINRFSKSIGDEMFAMAARHRFARPAYTYLASIGTFLELEMLDRLPVYTDNPYNVSIENMVMDTVNLLRGAISALGKDIKFKIADDLPEKDLGSMGIDAEAVEVTVEELIWNAAKYAPDGSTVEISWDEGSKKITVSNEGDPFEAGFDPFAPDNRGTNAGDVQGTSYGYGLYAAREDAKRIGASLSYSYENGRHVFKLELAPNTELPKPDPKLTSEPDPSSDGGLTGFRSGVKLWDDFAGVTDLPAFRSRVEADLAKLSDEGRLSYIGQISSGVENIFYSSPSDDVPILYARLDFIHLLASEASSARDRLPSQDAENPLWGYSVDLWNLFNSLAHAAVAIEKKLVEKNALDPRVSEQIADILFVMAGKGALYYDYHDGSPSNAFAQLPDVIARYHMLGLEEKAQRAEQLSTEVQARFGITDDPFEWARDYIKHNIKKDLRLIMDVPEEESRRSLLETINIGFESSGSHGNYRFAAEVFRYYAGALFDIAQKMEEAGKPDDVWQTFSDAATHFREKYKKTVEMGIAIGTIEANPELKDKGSIQDGQKSDALKLTELIGADDAEFAAAVEKMRTLLEDEALEVATQLGRMADELVRRHVERLSAPGVDAEVVRSVRQDFKMAYRQRWHVLAEAIKPSMAAKQHRIWTALYSSACQALEGLSSHLNILNDEINLDGFDSDSVRKRLERARRIADTAKYPVLESRGYETTISLVELSGGLLHHIGLREAEKRWDGDDIVFSAPADSKIDGSIRGIEVTSWSEDVPNDPALKIYLKLLGWTMKVAPAADGIFDVRINFGNGALPTAGHPRAVPAGRQENGASAGSGYSSATAGGDDKAPRRHERYFPDPLLASPGPDGEGLGGLTRSQDTNRFKGREFGINGADDSGRLELGMKLTVADLAKLSDKEQLAYIKDISREAERHFERSPSGDVAVLRERLALIAPLAERASLAHDRLLSRGVKYPLWGHGDLCNLFNPLARVAVDIEARLVDQNALTPATSEQIADILFYGILNGTPYYDRSDGELETTFSRLPDVIERYRALNLREKTQRAEGFLHEVQHKFGREKKAPFAWALGEIGTKVGKYLVLMQRETKGPHKSVWLGTIKNIIILSGSHGNYRFAAEVFRYYAGALFGVRQKMEEEGKPIEAWKSFNEAASDFHAKYLKARKMGLAVGTIEMQHPVTGEAVPRERIDRPFIDGLVTEVRRYFKGKFNDILKRYAAGEDRNGLVREIEREALQGRAGDAYYHFLEIAEWFGRVNGDLEGGFLAAMRHRMALPYRVYRGLATYIRRNVLDKFIAEGRLNIPSDATTIYQAVYDIESFLGSKISKKGIEEVFDPKPFQKATVDASTNFAMFERVAEVLISNAVNHGEHNVKVEWDDSTWTLIVTNDGPGIEAGKDIFQAGVRGTNTKGIEGTGYGLFTAKEDAASQGWSLSFTSRPGETVFRLRLSKPKN